MASNSSFHLSVGALVQTSFGTFFRSIVPFTLLGTLIMAPWIATHLWAVHNPMPPRPETSDVLEFALVQLVVLLLQVLLQYALTGAVTYGVVQQLSGEPASFATTVSKGLQVFGRTLATGILCGLRVLLYSLLLVVPGIMEFCRLFVAIPATVVEGTSASASVERSKQLTDGCRWQVFASVLVVNVISWLVSALVVAGITMAGSSASSPVLIALPVALAVLFTTLSATVAAVCYSLLRRGKENVDVKALSAVFA